MTDDSGGVKGRIAQLMIMVAFGRHVEVALDRAARFALSLVQVEDGIDEFRRFFLCLATTRDR